MTHPTLNCHTSSLLCPFFLSFFSFLFCFHLLSVLVFSLVFKLWLKKLSSQVLIQLYRQVSYIHFLHFHGLKVIYTWFCFNYHLNNSTNYKTCVNTLLSVLNIKRDQWINFVIKYDLILERLAFCSFLFSKAKLKRKSFFFNCNANKSLCKIKSFLDLLSILLTTNIMFHQVNQSNTSRLEDVSSQSHLFIFWLYPFWCSSRLFCLLLLYALN